MDGPCASQLNAAKACIDADPATCSCFVPPFETNFPESVAGAYRITMAFESPGTEGFCNVANAEVCKMFDAEASCCCQQETNDFIACEFTNTLGPQYGCGNCEASGCGDAAGKGGGGDGGGGLMMYAAVGGIVILILCCGLGFCYRKKKLAAAAKAKVRTCVDLGSIDPFLAGASSELN